MSLKYSLEAIELLDSPSIDGPKIASLFGNYKHVQASSKTAHGEEGSTDFIKIAIAGKDGKSSGGASPSMGIVGRLGGIGARPGRTGLVSDADGAVVAIAAAMKLSEMSQKGDCLHGDVIVTTHICPNAPTLPHEPVDFMGSPVSMEEMNEYEVLPEMEAVISIDTTKGNRVVNHKGIAISPTVKEGYILRVGERLIDLLESTTGKPAVTFPLSIQDITPYENGLYHLNSILQPSCATSAPVIGLGITAETIVPGCSTGASHETDISEAVRYSIEVAKEFTANNLLFFDEQEFKQLKSLYGSMRHFQKNRKLKN